MSVDQAMFLNESKVDLPEELRDRLTTVSRTIAKQLREQGETQESMKDSVVLLGLFSNNTERFSILSKATLRTNLANLKAELDALAEDEPKPELPRESLIQRCLEPSPGNAVRVLWLANGYNGTLQIHLDSKKGQLIEGRTERMGKEQTLTDVTEELLKSLKKYPPDVAKKILEQVHMENEHLLKLRNDIAADEEERRRIDEELNRHMPQFRERWEEVLRRVKKVPLPPATASATNFEALLMAATYVFDPVNSLFDTKKLGASQTAKLLSELIGFYGARVPAIIKLLRLLGDSLRGRNFSGALQDFGIDWMQSGFPKLEVGHKLAATLAMTDVPDDIEVLAPWKAWSMVVPPGLFGEQPGDETYARFLCRGAEPAFLVLNTGEVFGPFTRKSFLDWHRRADEPVLAIANAIDSLIRGACLALSNPDEYKRNTIKEAGSKGKQKREQGLPDFSVSRFMLSAPVEIDLRQMLLDEIAGKKRHSGGGGSPTVQFFVRGHWRNQAHGPGRSLRKQIRIEGFWKGPEEGRVLLRNYKVKEDEGAKTTEGGAQDTQAVSPRSG